MNTPARLLRASADPIIQARPFLTEREQKTRDTILAAGSRVMAQFGRHSIRLAEFAAAIRLSPSTIRRHFADLDNLLANILRDHLMSIATALGAVPRDAPNRPAARRAAYLAATRTALGAPTEAHLLLIRDRHLLPPDERDSVEAIRANIGDIIAGAHAELTLALLDTPQIHPSRMEATLAALLATQIEVEPAAPAAPARPQTPSLVLDRALRPLRPASATAIDWPSPALWQRPTHGPGAPRTNGHHPPDIREKPRRASS